MTNNEIAKHFSLLADLMELHDENAFKIKSYAFAGRTLNKRNEALSTLTLDELENVEGIGKAIAAKILQLTQTGKLDLLENYLAKTP
ncbi:MAG TPA: helix-hairpin-helix domain-containing protein, partial [Chitinophagales bacterium]|nr:helix-hairpin-helix domain-containing protein [Chitinophagales bacterium]